MLERPWHIGQKAAEQLGRGPACLAASLHCGCDTGASWHISFASLLPDVQQHCLATANKRRCSNSPVLTPHTCTVPKSALLPSPTTSFSGVFSQLMLLSTRDAGRSPCHQPLPSWNMQCCGLHPLVRVSQSCLKVCLLGGTEEERAKIVQPAGKADPQGSKKSDKDTPEVRTPRSFF